MREIDVAQAVANHPNRRSSWIDKMAEPGWLWFLGTYLIALVLAGGDYLFIDPEIAIEAAMYFPLGLTAGLASAPHWGWWVVTMMLIAGYVGYGVLIICGSVLKNRTLWLILCGTLFLNVCGWRFTWWAFAHMCM